MDVENWYHLDYFLGKTNDRSHNMLDGIEVYQEVMEENNLLSSFFVLGETAEELKTTLRQLSEKGHDIGSHGWSHNRPLNMSAPQFKDEITSCKKDLENILGEPVIGYRAPCFSLDRERLDIVKQVGFKYDSSRILFEGHPLYGTLDVQGFAQKGQNIFSQDDFYEFQVSTLPIMGKQFPVSGGGYLRIFPWVVMKCLMKRYLSNSTLYVLYTHPFELSRKPNPPFPENTNLLTKFRFSFGRATVLKKLNACIHILKENDFQFTTFANLRENLINGSI
jgi:polysaccharide deacetylase family protein (PEP-CTERM system associated)